MASDSRRLDEKIYVAAEGGVFGESTGYFESDASYALFPTIKFSMALVFGDLFGRTTRNFSTRHLDSGAISNRGANAYSTRLAFLGRAEKGWVGRFRSKQLIS